MSTDASDPASTQKEKLRQRFLRYRQSLSEGDYRRRSAAIVACAEELEELGAARTVHVYWPMVAQREIDVRPLISHLESRGADIVLPVVLTFVRGETPAMSHIRHPGAEHLRANRWGISEPPSGQQVDLETLDAVLVPALGAGRNGHRIGHGRGYYDAFLSAVPVPKICLVYDACLLDAVPCQSHDVPMDILVTERGIARV
jgi:5-formyltetrahydrofolate cyclo-ligase